MKHWYHKLFRLLTNRLARNIYFWVLLIFFSTNITSPLWQNLSRIALLGVEASLLYFNNLLLVPRMLVRRKYVSYVAALLVSTFAAACCYSVILKLSLAAHPGTPVNDISVLLSQPIDISVTPASVLHDVFLYFLPLLSLAVNFTLVWFAMDYMRQQAARRESEKKQVEAELRFLKGQINPHFLFNTLNNLYGLTVEGSKEAPAILLKLSAILRYLLYEANAPKMSFEKEKEIMQSFIDLELLRIANKNGLHFTISADTACDIPPLLWLPVLENVFKHGKTANGIYDIDYRFTVTGNSLHIFSKNSY